MNILKRRSKAEYTAKDVECLEKFISDDIGQFDTVLHEMVSEREHIDIAIVEQPLFGTGTTLVTMGMGSNPMKTPRSIAREGKDRCELIMVMPDDWESSDEPGWQAQLLQMLAHYPFEEKTWLGLGHTLDLSGILPDDVPFGGVMIFPAQSKDYEFICFETENKDTVYFHWVIPLYKEEIELKLSDEDRFYELMDKIDMPPTFDESRMSILK